MPSTGSQFILPVLISTWSSRLIRNCLSESTAWKWSRRPSNTCKRACSSYSLPHLHSGHHHTSQALVDPSPSFATSNPPTQPVNAISKHVPNPSSSVHHYYCHDKYHEKGLPFPGDKYSFSYTECNLWVWSFIQQQKNVLMYCALDTSNVRNSSRNNARVELYTLHNLKEI